MAAVLRPPCTARRRQASRPLDSRHWLSELAVARASCWTAPSPLPPPCTAPPVHATIRRCPAHPRGLCRSFLLEPVSADIPAAAGQDVPGWWGGPPPAAWIPPDGAPGGRPVDAKRRGVPQCVVAAFAAPGGTPRVRCSSLRAPSRNGCDCGRSWGWACARGRRSCGARRAAAATSSAQRPIESGDRRLIAPLIRPTVRARGPRTTAQVREHQNEVLGRPGAGGPAGQPGGLCARPRAAAGEEGGAGNGAGGRPLAISGTRRPKTPAGARRRRGVRMLQAASQCNRAGHPTTHACMPSGAFTSLSAGSAHPVSRTGAHPDAACAAPPRRRARFAGASPRPPQTPPSPHARRPWAAPTPPTSPSPACRAAPRRTA